MSRIQTLFHAILPRRWFESMAQDSARWMVRCLTCGHSRSIWELGGVRWRAVSAGKRTLIWCERCGRRRCARVAKEEGGAPSGL